LFLGSIILAQESVLKVLLILYNRANRFIVLPQIYLPIVIIPFSE